MVKICRRCNSANIDSAKFCSQCGLKFDTMEYNKEQEKEEEERVYEDDYLFYMLNDDKF